jgi:alpha-beta hydrolase superfamily lysophospholipase
MTVGHKFFLFKVVLLPLCIAMSMLSYATQVDMEQNSASRASQQSMYAAFSKLYKKEWGVLSPCKETRLNRTSVCSPVLRSEGNAPFMLSHDKPSEKVAVLIHGLSDSPFFMREIANILYHQGFDVLVPLLPGHGLRDASDDMTDGDLAERWQAHVDEVIALADTMGDTLVVGGFSTGGALAVEHYLDEGKNIDGLMLFSGALALSENAESMSRIWGIKWVAKVIDGSYVTHGPNPYKYPHVAGFAGLELMDIIEQIRQQLKNNKQIDIPLFAAHSQADSTTPIHGVETLMEHSKGPNTFFVIDGSYELCHADLVINTPLLHQMKFNAKMVDETELCAVPKANPLFDTMAMMLKSYLQQF